MPDYQVKNVEPVVVGTDIQARIFTLARGDVIPWHYHSESTDHYFVLRGTLTIETRSPDHRHEPSVGERYKILLGTTHRISNEAVSECQFLLGHDYFPIKTGLRFSDTRAPGDRLPPAVAGATGLVDSVPLVSDQGKPG